MDKVVSKVAGLGVPGLMLVIAIGSTGLAGAAAITAAFAALGPGGMIGGVAVLVLAALVADAIAKFGYDAILIAVLKELHKKGYTKAELILKIEKQHVSKDLKRKAREAVEKF